MAVTGPTQGLPPVEVAMGCITGEVGAGSQHPNSNAVVDELFKKGSQDSKHGSRRCTSRRPT